MKERPILMNAPMVRATLDGSKTQTRRIVKPGKWEHENAEYGVSFGNCPYGQPGDRLWVRETWGVVSHSWDADGNMIDWTPDRPATQIQEMRFGQGYYSGHVIYAADGAHEWAGDDDGGGEPRSAWHPSIHMPRAASRINLEITGVRVERLQDISEADAKAEGATPSIIGAHLDHLKYRAGFQSLWESINGPGSWEANPWVWVVEFKRVEAMKLAA